MKLLFALVAACLCYVLLLLGNRRIRRNRERIRYLDPWKDRWQRRTLLAQIFGLWILAVLCLVTILAMIGWGYLALMAR